MTNHNPGMSQSNSQIERDIIAKVNAHADRSLDRLFADIDELLNGDGDGKDRAPNRDALTPPPATSEHRHQPTATESGSFALPQLSSSDLSAAAPPAQPESAPAAKTKKSLPLWLKALIGVGAATIAVGGGLAWLVNERKVEIPQNIDTSWLPFQSKAAPADVKFADYLRKSIANIEANANKPTPIATTAAAPITAISPSTIDPYATGATILAPAATNPAPVKQIALVKTIQTGKQSSAMFQVSGESKMVTIGQTIGTSDWSLLTVAKNEVLVKRKGGELRSVYVGQKF
jgi:hypothetical protein